MNGVAGHLVVVKQALAAEKARARRIVQVHETGFLPAALEVVERPVSPTSRVTAWVLLAGMLLMVLWLVLGRIDIVATAPGKIIPAENIKLIQPADAGVVRQILVHDGDHVKKGQPLVILDPTASSAELEQARKALETAQLDAARGRAVLTALNGGPFIFQPPPGTNALVAETHRSLASAQLQQIQSGVSQGGASSAAAVAATSEARIQAAKLSETIPLLREQLAANEKLLAKGFVSKLRVIEMRRQYLSAIRDRQIASSTLVGAGAQAASASASAAQSSAQLRADLLSQLNKAESDVVLRHEELLKAERRSNLQRMVSPVDGTIAQLSIHTEGGVVEAAKPIMAVVPSGGQLVAEVKLLNSDIGFVQEGQEVAVKLDAFPFTRHGTIKGKVLSISSDAVVDEKMGPVYVTRIALSKTKIDRGDKVVPILPGMVATADIKTGRRSFMSYLLSPIEQASMEAARER
jgi:HlyD family type I secretion membrane fusion protein